MQVGTRLGAYEVIVKLGEGGLGEVYRARDTKLNRDVALKTLPATLAADPDYLARFKRESQLLASLNHANIAAVYGFEDADSVHAIAMELVEGEDLAERIAREPIPVGEALAIARQLADALEAAHRPPSSPGHSGVDRAIVVTGTVPVSECNGDSPPGGSDGSVTASIPGGIACCGRAETARQHGAADRGGIGPARRARRLPRRRQEPVSRCGVHHADTASRR